MKQAMDFLQAYFSFSLGHLCCIVNMAYDTRSGDWARWWRLTRSDKFCTSGSVDCVELLFAKLVVVEVGEH